MALNNLKKLMKSMSGVTDAYDIANTASTLETVSEALPEYVVGGVNTATGDIYEANNGEVAVLSKKLKLSYDFATDGGAIGDVTLRGGALPKNAVVTGGYIYNHTAMTSGGSATVAINIPTDDAAGLKAATAYGTIGAAGAVALIQTGAAANFSEITTAEREITISIATAALTAGAFTLVLEYDVLAADTTS